MECKYGNNRRQNRERQRINRYIMECKFYYAGNNVFTKRELIDTLWNVNVADTVSNDGDFRINRYIMECK